MAIYTERIIRVNNNHASMDKDIYVYRGNRNIEIQFTIVDHQFKFKDVNLVEQVSPSHAYVTLLTPQMLQIGTGKAEVLDGVIKLVINSAMIDEKTECGDYTIVIDLYDEVSDALITIPPIENQLHVLDRMTEIDDIPDELRFVFDAQTGNLEVANIDLTYDETSGEIKTIEGIPLHDKTARRLIENIGLDVEEYQETVDELQGDMLNAKTEINRISPIVTELVDSGYKQIKPNMSQAQIQNELNKAGIIIFREGIYNLNDELIIPSKTNLLIEKEVQLNLTSGGNILELRNANDVSIDGNLILNGGGLYLNSCMDIVINNICIHAAECGIDIVGGDNIVINNPVTQECSVAGCRLTNGDTPMNVLFNNHIDIQSAKALHVSTNSSVALAGRIKFMNSLYEVSEEDDPCIVIDNDINAPRVSIYNPIIQVNNHKNVVISLERNSIHKLGGIEIVEPIFNGISNANVGILIQNNYNINDIARIKIIRPEYNIKCSSIIDLEGGAAYDKSIIIELNKDFEHVLNNNINLSDFICSNYVLQSDASSNATVNLDNAPINFECEFINKSSSKSLFVNGFIDDKMTIELKYNDFMRIKHMGEGRWIILDENFKNKMTTIYPLDSSLNIINARYLRVQIDTEVTMVLPSISENLSEIHLFMNVLDGGAINYPENIKWTNKEPEFSEVGFYELILTYVSGIWLIGCVSYE